MTTKRTEKDDKEDGEKDDKEDGEKDDKEDGEKNDEEGEDGGGRGGGRRQTTSGKGHLALAVFRCFSCPRAS